MALGEADASIAASGSTIAAGNTEVHTFATKCMSAWVFIVPESNRIFGRWNSDTCTLATADFVLDANGAPVANSEGSRIDGTTVTKVALYSVAGATVNVHFFVRGRVYR